MPGAELWSGTEVDAEAGDCRGLWRVRKDVTDLLVNVDVGAAKAVDRLLGIAGEDESTGAGSGLRPIVGIWFSGEQQRDLGL